MYCLTFQVRPKPDSEHAAKYAGAYAVCWIDFKDQWGAEQLARIALDEEGWIIEKCEEVHCPTRDNYESPDLHESLHLFEEAQRIGWTISLKYWGHDAPDKNSEPQ